MKLNSNKRSLVIVTAYRPCRSHGSSTAWMQQWALLRQSGKPDPDPDPIKKIYADLETFLTNWIEQGCELLVMIDANESIGEKPGRLLHLIGKVGLIDLLKHRYPNNGDQNTYA
jgi:hypothetical protein